MAEKVCAICKKNNKEREIKAVTIPVSWDDRPEGNVWNQNKAINLCLYHRYRLLKYIKSEAWKASKYGKN